MAAVNDLKRSPSSGRSRTTTVPPPRAGSIGSQGTRAGGAQRAAFDVDLFATLTEAQRRAASMHADGVSFEDVAIEIDEELEVVEAWFLFSFTTISYYEFMCWVRSRQLENLMRRGVLLVLEQAVDDLVNGDENERDHARSVLVRMKLPPAATGWRTPDEIMDDLVERQLEREERDLDVSAASRYAAGAAGKPLPSRTRIRTDIKTGAAGALAKRAGRDG